MAVSASTRAQPSSSHIIGQSAMPVDPISGSADGIAGSLDLDTFEPVSLDDDNPAQPATEGVKRPNKNKAPRTAMTTPKHSKSFLNPAMGTSPRSPSIQDRRIAARSTQPEAVRQGIHQVASKSPALAPGEIPNQHRSVGLSAAIASPMSLQLPRSRPSEGRDLLAVPNGSSTVPSSSEFPPRRQPLTPRSPSFHSVGRFSIYSSSSPSGSLTSLHAPPTPDQQLANGVRGSGKRPQLPRRQLSMSSLAIPSSPLVGSNNLRTPLSRSARTSPTRPDDNVSPDSSPFLPPARSSSFISPMTSPTFLPQGLSSSTDDFALPIRRPQSSRRLSGISSTNLSPSGLSVDDSDHSADDIEVPQEVIFWNVPLTPEIKSSPTRSPPKRNSMTSDSPNVKSSPASADVRRSSNQRTSSRLNQQSQTSPVRGRSRSTVDSQTPERVGQLPMLNRRSTWDHAMDELSEEAKDLTVALEGYRENISRDKRQQLIDRYRKQKGIPVPDRPTSASIKEKAAKESKSLMPEDMAENSITRPSHLPRKSKQEESRHLKEYQRMMQLSQQQEAKKRQKRNSDVAEYLKLQEDSYTFWDSPNFQLSDPKVQDIVWQSGIPDRRREKIWLSLIDNRLELDQLLFDKLLAKSSVLSADLESYVCGLFPETKLFVKTGPLYDSLVTVLRAYITFRPEVTNTSALVNIAGTLLLHLSPEQTFVSLANIVDTKPLRYIYSANDSKLTKFYLAFDHAFAVHIPSLHHHFLTTLDIRGEHYIPAFVSTLFTLQLPVDFIPRIWDILFLESESQAVSFSSTTKTTSSTRFELVLISAMLTILNRLRTDLMVFDRERVLAQISWTAKPIDVSSGDAEVLDVVTEIEFVRTLRDYFLALTSH
ncbi:rab-GTPase-TBC domain-containing protein [Lipomyces oligophaga]|uniref:rab-GTPase-TBC domain-containing protein n=1 Tax=Lipomyces oligophaga TaxID=45792 RepID=UPI0034CEB7E0